MAEILAFVGTAVSSAMPAIGTGLSSLAGSASTAMSLVQGGTSILSAISSIGGGRAAERTARQNAELSGMAEYIGGEAAALSIRRQLAEDLSALSVGYAASGVTSQGTPARIAEEWSKNARRDIGFEKRAAGIRQISAFMGGRTGQAAGGMIEAGGTIGNFLLDFLKRGGPIADPGGGAVPFGAQTQRLGL